MSQVHIEVNLLGRRFAVGCPKEEQASLVEAVALLEQRMAEVRDVGRVVEVDKIAIIAALCGLDPGTAARAASDSEA